jgi:hypothetical protein
VELVLCIFNVPSYYLSSGITLNFAYFDLQLSYVSIWGVDVWIHVFLISAIVGGKWLASRLGRFTLGKRAPGTNWIGDWMGPRTGLDDVERRKILPLLGLEIRPLGRLACSPSRGRNIFI